MATVRRDGWCFRRVQTWMMVGMVTLLTACGSPEEPKEPRDSAGKVLFDQGHGETAGNADWTITGGYSDFAQALRDKGYEVDSVSSELTPSRLEGIDVLILPEPNQSFSPSEKEAVNEFVRNGGGVYLIADHHRSDRDNDGWDSVAIFNGYRTDAGSSEEGWVGEVFGFTFERQWLSKDPITDVKKSPVTEGVKSAGCWGCTVMRVTGSNASIAEDIILESKPYHLHGEWGRGRFAALGDSSPYDDGTGAPGDRLHPNWEQYDHRRLAVNTVEWLARDR